MTPVLTASNQYFRTEIKIEIKLLHIQRFGLKTCHQAVSKRCWQGWRSPEGEERGSLHPIQTPTFRGRMLESKTWGVHKNTALAVTTTMNLVINKVSVCGCQHLCQCYDLVLHPLNLLRWNSEGKFLMTRGLNQAIVYATPPSLINTIMLSITEVNDWVCDNLSVK